MVSQEERLIFWEFIVWAILSKKAYMYMCPIPNGFRGSAISLYRRATRHVLSRVARCIDVDGGISEKNIILDELYQLCRLNNKYRHYKLYAIFLSYQQFWNCTLKSGRPFGIKHMYIYIFA
jgi:hypothetical protein